LLSPNASGTTLYTSHGQHFGDQLFNACGVGESALVARLVLLRRALAHTNQLQ